MNHARYVIIRKGRKEMSSSLDMLKLLAMGQKLEPTGAEPMNYERLTSEYDSERGDIRADDHLFCELCKKALHNKQRSINGTAKIDKNILESLAKHKAPSSLIESSTADNAEARIFSRSGGSVILARIDKASQSIVPYDIRESKVWSKSYWFHTKTDTYRFDASNAQQAQDMFESQVPEKDRKGDVSVDVHNELKSCNDEGAPYVVTIFKRNGDRQSMQEVQTMAKAFYCAVSESSDGDKFTIRNSAKKIVLSHECKGDPGDSQPVESQTQELPSIMGNVPPGKIVVVLRGESIGLTDEKPGNALLQEMGSGANMSDRYLIVKKIIDNYCLVEEAKPGILTQRDKDMALMVSEMQTGEMMINESSSSNGFQEFMEQIVAHGFKGMHESVEDSLFKDGFIYSEAAGLGITVSANTPAALWYTPIYKTFRVDASKLQQEVANMPREFFENEGSDTLRKYMAGWDNVKAVRDVAEWSGVRLPEKAMNAKELLATISEGSDAKANLHAKTLIKLYGIDEAKSRAEKMHKKYVDEFPNDKGFTQYFSTVRKCIANRSENADEDGKNTP